MDTMMAQNTPESTVSPGNARVPNASPGRVRRLGAIGLIALLVVAAGAVVMTIRAVGGGGVGGTAAPAQAEAGAVPLAATGETIDAILNAAGAAQQRGELAKAETILRSASRSHADEQRLYLQLAELLAGQRRFDEAYEQYTRALAAGPRDAASEFAAGTVASAAGRPERAVEHYAAAQAAEPSDWKAPLFLGQVQLKLGRAEEAKKSLLMASRLKPDAAIAWGTLAEIALRENKPSLALVHVAKARELEPDVTVWRVLAGRALKREGRPEEALELFVGLSPAARAEPGVMTLMAECYGLLERPRDAAAMYVAAANSYPSRGEWAMEAALWSERAGDLAAARTYAARAAGLGTASAADMVARLGS